MDTKNSDRPWMRSFGLFGLIVSDMLVCTGAGMGLGYLAWTKWGFPWWILLVLSLAGLVLAFYRLYLYSKKDME